MPRSTNFRREVLDGLPLFDHHCHGVIEYDLSAAEFESLISESSRPAAPGTTRFDSQIGVQVLSQCAPVLGAERFCSPTAYLDARAALGADEVDRRLLKAARLTTLGVDTGHAAGLITGPERLGELAGATAHEVVRLESLAEGVAHTMRAEENPLPPSRDNAALFLQKLEDPLDMRLARAIGVKSIAAYRYGLDFLAARPATDEVIAAAVEFLSQPATMRLDDPVLIRHLLWLAIDRKQVIQLHIGYGDDDVDLHRCNPLLLTELLRTTRDTGARFALLHCYPFVREAGYLADVYEHVYFDVGLAINYTGSHSPRVIAESLELAPFGKILFSTDAFGLPELYFVGAQLFRRGLAEVLDYYQREWGWPDHYCRKVAELMCYDNAARLYGVDDRKN